jgi:hypothetical protein
MSARRITVSVPEAVALRLKKAAGKTPVSTWLTDLIEEHLDERELEGKWEAFYAGVSPDAGAARKADEILKRATRRKRVA